MGASEYLDKRLDDLEKTIQIVIDCAEFKYKSRGKLLEKDIEVLY